MRIYASEICAAARENLKGHWTEAALLIFVYVLIVGSLSSIPLVGSGISLLFIPMGWGVTCAFLAMKRGEDDPMNISCLIVGYKDFVRIFLTLLLQGVYVFLWSLLLVIPGIIKSLSYAMTSYVLRDYPELRYNGAIEMSMAMMQGHKWELFYLYLTFIGWGILCVFTLGIGLFWLEPYVETSVANFYEEVKEDYLTGDASRYSKE